MYIYVYIYIIYLHGNLYGHVVCPLWVLTVTQFGSLFILIPRRKQRRHDDHCRPSLPQIFWMHNNNDKILFITITTSEIMSCSVWLVPNSRKGPNSMVAAFQGSISVLDGAHPCQTHDWNPRSTEYRGFESTVYK